jgi:type IV pilus assembly protein PilV
MKPLFRESLRCERGMTLVEALIALVVLSIGLLGVAALQITSLRNNHSAHVRSQATALAHDISDRMRANRNDALAGAYDVALGGSVAGVTLAATDVSAWKQAIAAALPGGDGALFIDPASRVVTITIQWDDSRGEEAPLTFTTTTRI